ncbi:MAG TPA: hypothetical protein VH088_08345 [Terriglobales bacterium]|jgi:hypothetical protein|nr:hypothetical protein [Terriglobales bacterium]
MVANRLVRLIESHCEDLSQSLVTKLHRSERTEAYRQIPAHELKAAVLEVYENLGEWLLSKTETDVELRYRELGKRRMSQGVPLSQFMASMLMTKEHLWAFLRRESISDGALQLYGELEFLQALANFYDRAIYYASQGYEQKQQAAKVA